MSVLNVERRLFARHSCGSTDKFTQGRSHLSARTVVQHSVQKPYLVQHQQTHSGEKPFVCSTCGKVYTAKNTLVQHQRVHIGEKPFLCTDCGKAFTIKQHLMPHQRTHSGEKPFSCSKCGKAFTSKSSLLQHQRIHTGERPFVCTECGKAKGSLEGASTDTYMKKPFSNREYGASNRKKYLSRKQRSLKSATTSTSLHTHNVQKKRYRAGVCSFRLFCNKQV